MRCSVLRLSLRNSFVCRLGRFRTAAGLEGPLEEALLALPEARRRAVLEAYDSDGVTFLAHCAICGDVDLAEVALRAGASPTAFEPGIAASMQPLAHGVQNSSQFVIRLLLANGAAEDVTALRKGPLCIAADVGDWEGRRHRVRPLIQLLLAADLDVNHQCTADSEASSTALAVSCRRGQSDVVELLLAAGADPQISTLDGETPLSFAVAEKNDDCADLILGRLCALRALPSRCDVVFAALSRRFSGQGGELQTYARSLVRLLVSSLLYATPDCSMKEDCFLSLVSTQAYNQYGKNVHW